MLRASFYLPDHLHNRLELVSKRKKQSLSHLATLAFEKFLASEEKTQTDETYKAFAALKGLAHNGPETNGSETIDETLYGEHGAWRGSEPPDYE